MRRNESINHGGADGTVSVCSSLIPPRATANIPRDEKQCQRKIELFFPPSPPLSNQLPTKTFPPILGNLFLYGYGYGYRLGGDGSGDDGDDVEWWWHRKFGEDSPRPSPSIHSFHCLICWKTQHWIMMMFSSTLYYFSFLSIDWGGNSAAAVQE